MAVGAEAQFAPALPGYEFEFPRDHGTHDDYRTEWWYYTGHLETDGGMRYGFEVTFFRVGVAPPPVRRQDAGGPAGWKPALRDDEPQAGTRWELHDLSLAHFAITDVDGRDFRYYEKLNRSSPFTASQAAGHLDVFNEGWRVTTMPDGAWRLVAAAGSDAIDLTMRTHKPPALHGQNGVSVKGERAGQV